MANFTPQTHGVNFVGSRWPGPYFPYGTLNPGWTRPSYFDAPPESATPLSIATRSIIDQLFDTTDRTPSKIYNTRAYKANEPFLTSELATYNEISQKIGSGNIKGTRWDKYLSGWDGGFSISPDFSTFADSEVVKPERGLSAQSEKTLREQGGLDTLQQYYNDILKTPFESYMAQSKGLQGEARQTLSRMGFLKYK